MTSPQFPPLLLSDKEGNIWKQPHLKCGQDSLVPSLNENAASGPSWWWWCEGCRYYVRPLAHDELSVVNDVLARALEERRNKPSSAKKWAKRRGRSATRGR